MTITLETFQGKKFYRVDGHLRVLVKTFGGRDPRPVLECLIRVFRDKHSATAAGLAAGINPESARRILGTLGLHKCDQVERSRHYHIEAPRPPRPGEFVTCACGCHRVKTGKRGVMVGDDWWAPACYVQMREARK